jgi:hypothetical protein
MNKQIQLFQALQKFFLNTDLEFWECSKQELFSSILVEKLSELFPRWFEIIQQGMQTDNNEALRTLRHTLHTLQGYFLIITDQLEKNVQQRKIESFRDQLKELYEYHPLYVPLILLYHDIGRPFNRTWHTFKSEDLIRQHKLLEQFNLSKITKKLILTVIKHHLLVGTIYTGESSYYGSIVLYSELKRNKKGITETQIRILFNTMKAFTVIDIWGYDYSKIYDHYFSYYNEISENLIEIYQKNITLDDESQQKRYLKEELFRLDNQNLKWRIACSMRIFQFITVKPYLTEKFYFHKIEKGLASIDMTWEEFQENLRKVHPQIQFKYALPLMMILSSKEFRREPIDDSFRIQPEIFSFWSTCAKIIERAISTDPKSESQLFYIVFDFPRHWFFNSPEREKIKGNIINALSSSTFSFNKSKSAFILTIDMKTIKRNQ